MTDTRIIKSKKALKTALISLLATRTLNSISVQDICQKANITRVTFYAHYKDKNDLMMEYINDCLTNIFNFGEELNSLALEEKLSYLSTTIFTNTLSIIKDFPNFNNIISNQDNSLIIQMLQLSAMNTLIDKFQESLKQEILLQFSKELISSFLIGGLVQMVAIYIKNRNIIDLEELKKQGTQIINKSLHAIFSN